MNQERLGERARELSDLDELRRLAAAGHDAAAAVLADLAD
ncbi:hypothetical protein L3i22_024870 [Actinoplanes sp. L3-i22]|nr:hypothetical protein L3i22_024870 [Actinoplanes sp. L3-i22]